MTIEIQIPKNIRDRGAREVLRVWSVNEQLAITYDHQLSGRIVIDKDSGDDDPATFGVLLAWMAGDLASAIAEKSGQSRELIIDKMTRVAKAVFHETQTRSSNDPPQTAP